MYTVRKLKEDNLGTDSIVIVIESEIKYFWSLHEINNCQEIKFQEMPTFGVLEYFYRSTVHAHVLKEIKVI